MRSKKVGLFSEREDINNFELVKNRDHPCGERRIMD